MRFNRLGGSNTPDKHWILRGASYLAGAAVWCCVGCGLLCGAVWDVGCAVVLCGMWAAPWCCVGCGLWCGAVRDVVLAMASFEMWTAVWSCVGWGLDCHPNTYNTIDKNVRCIYSPVDYFLPCFLRQTVAFLLISDMRTIQTKDDMLGQFLHMEFHFTSKVVRDQFDLMHAI